MQVFAPPPTYLHVYVLKCTPPLTSRCQTSSTVKWDHKARAAVLLDRLTDGWKDSCFQVRISCVGCELCVPRETGPLWHIQLSLAYFPPVSVTVKNDEKPRYHRQIAKIWRLYLLLPKHAAQRICTLHSFQCSHGCWKEAARELLHLNVAVTWINMCGFLHFCFFFLFLFFPVLLCVISRLSHSCVPSLNQIIWKALGLYSVSSIM